MTASYCQSLEEQENNNIIIQKEQQSHSFTDHNNTIYQSKGTTESHALRSTHIHIAIILSTCDDSLLLFLYKLYG